MDDAVQNFSLFLSLKERLLSLKYQIHRPTNPYKEAEKVFLNKLVTAGW